MKKVYSPEGTNWPWQVRYDAQHGDTSWATFRTETEADKFMSRFKVYELTPNDFDGGTDERDDEILWIIAENPPTMDGFYTTEINIPLDSAGINYVKET